MNEAPLLSLKDVSRHYPSGDDFTTVLKHVNLTIRRGEMVAIIGASGSGKSTLMNILGCLDRPSEGEYLISGRATSELEADELAQLRREHFGFIFSATICSVSWTPLAMLRFQPFMQARRKLNGATEPK